MISDAVVLLLLLLQSDVLMAKPDKEVQNAHTPITDMLQYCTAISADADTDSIHSTPCMVWYGMVWYGMV